MALPRNNLMYTDFEDNGAFGEDLFDLYPAPLSPLSQVAPVTQAPVIQAPLSTTATSTDASRYNISSPEVQAQVFAEQEAARQAEAARVAQEAEAARLAELQNTYLQQQAEAQRQAELQQQAEAQRQAELAQQAEQERLGALQQAELAQQAEAARQAELARQAEQTRIGALQQSQNSNATVFEDRASVADSGTNGALTQANAGVTKSVTAPPAATQTTTQTTAPAPTAAKAPSQEAINTVKSQILGQGLTSKWSGEGLGSAEANAEDMAKILAGIGITDISQFGKIPQYQQADVQYGVNGQVARQDADGNYYIRKSSGTFDSEGNEQVYAEYVDPSQLQKIYGHYSSDGETTTFIPADQSKVTMKDGVPTVQVGETFGNKVTGQAVPNTYSERQTGNFFGGTFSGKGNTGYGVQFDAKGNPIFYTVGASSNDLANIMKDLGPIGQIGLAIATGGLSLPQQIAANLAMNVLSGKDLGDALKSAAISFAGAQIPGLDAMKGGADYIAKLGLSPELTSTLTNAFQNAAVSGAGALLSGGNVGEAMMRGAVAGGTNGAVNALMGNIAGFSDLTPTQQKVAINAVTGLISGKPLDQIVINSAIAAANAEVAKAKGVNPKTTTDGTTTDDAISKELNRQLTIDASGARDIDAAAEFAQAQGYNKFTFDGKTYTLDTSNAENTIKQLEADALATNTANNLKGGEFEGVDAAVAANAARNNTVIGNTEADTLEEAAALARSRNPTGTTFTYGGNTYTLNASSAALDNEIASARQAEVLDNIKNAKTFNEAFATARAGLGAGKTFTWQGKEYSTATAEERPDLATSSIDAINARNLATVTDASKTVAAQSDTAARATAAEELAKQQAAAAKTTESTGFFSNIAKAIQDQMKLSSEAANDYLKNNPNSPITNSVSTAMEAAGNLQKNAAGGVALLFDNKPLADAFIKSGDDLTKFGQSIGNGVVDTKNWNDTMSLLEKANGWEKLGVMAGRIMDGTSGLGRQVEVELRQELPGLFLGGGSVKGILLATGAMDVAETTGNAAIDAYDDAVKKGLTHDQALTEARKAGAAAGVAEAAVQLTLGKIADVVIGNVGSLVGKTGAKILGEGVVEGSQEGGSSLAVNAALGQDLDVNKALTQTVAGGVVGKSTTATTSTVDVATSQTINNNITAAVTTGDASTVNSAITGSVQQSLTNGASVNTAVGGTVTSAITNGADAGTSITTAVSTAVTSGADVTQTVTASIDSAITAGADTTTAVNSTVTSAITSGADSSVVVNSAVTSAITSGADLTTSVTTAVQAAVTAGADVTTATNSATTAAVTASITSGTDASTAITSSVTAAVTAGADVTTATTTATTAAVSTQITSGTDASTAVTTSINAAVTAGGDVTTVSNAAVTSAVTTSITSGADVTTTITNSVQGAVTAGADVNTAATTATSAAVTASITSGTDTTTAVTTAVNAAVDAGANVTSATNAAVTAAVTTAVTTGADTTTAINSSVTAAVTTGADTTTAVTTAVTAAVDASVTQAVTNGTDVSTAITNSVTSSISSAVTNNTSVETAVDTAVSTAITSAVTNNADVTAAVDSAVSSAITSAVQNNVDSSTAITTAVDSAVTTAIENNVDSSSAITTAVDTAITTAITNDSNANVNTVVNDAVTSAVDAAVNAGVDINTAVNAAINAAVNTKTNIDIPALIKTAVDSATKTSEIVSLRNSVNDLIANASKPVVTPAPTPEPKPKPTTASQSSGLNAGLLAGIMSAPELARLPPQMLKAYMTQDKFVDPLAKLQALQEDMNAEKMPATPQVNTQEEDMPDQGTWRYGTAPDDIESLFGDEEEAPAFKAGGYVAPLQMASGGAMPLPLLAKSGGALGALPRNDGRLDFRHGAHVAGEGDGQSDDIKAMLADGEFVFPADVVSALGNGSTKAGSDKLYEMMHSIRARARSKKPKDLPPPALKSPLDYLKKVRSK